MRIFWVLGLLFLSTSAQAQSQWEHNGSTVTLHASGANREFRYLSPRSGLSVQSGTVVFNGRKDGDSYSGIAYVFHSRCGATGYSVSGPVSQDQRIVTMYGKAPQKDGNCRVVGYRDDVLVFSFQQPTATAQAPSTRARETVRIGDNAIAFHPNFCGSNQTVTLYDASRQVLADFGALMEEAAQAGIEIRESNFIKNACALFLDGKPYVVLGRLIPDKEAGDEDEVRGLDILVLGHEIGHHACKHTIGRLVGRGWEKELEADRYGGMIVGKMFRAGKIRNWNSSATEFLDVVANGLASGVYGTGGITHPPAELRIRAVREGFFNGARC